VRRISRANLAVCGDNHLGANDHLANLLQREAGIFVFDNLSCEKVVLFGREGYPSATPFPVEKLSATGTRS
jgi:hypothetical protein